MINNYLQHSALPGSSSKSVSISKASPAHDCCARSKVNMNSKFKQQFHHYRDDFEIYVIKVDISL